VKQSPSHWLSQRLTVFIVWLQRTYTLSRQCVLRVTSNIVTKILISNFVLKLRRLSIVLEALSGVTDVTQFRPRCYGHIRRVRGIGTKQSVIEQLTDYLSTNGFTVNV
jgi:hypothetical protein